MEEAFQQFPCLSQIGLGHKKLYPSEGTANGDREGVNPGAFLKEQDRDAVSVQVAFQLLRDQAAIHFGQHLPV
jgi:hypothetical protein